MFIPQVVKKPGVKTKFKKLKTNRWSGYMSGSSQAAKKLSPKRTALNLCRITLSVERGTGSREHRDYY